MKFKIHRERPDIMEACDKLIGIMTSPEWMEAVKDGHASVDSLVFEIAEEYSSEADLSDGESQANARASPSVTPGDSTRIILTEKEPNEQQRVSIESAQDNA